MKTALSREGIYFLFIVIVILVGSVIREVNPMLLFAAFLCAPLVIAWRLGRRSLRGLQVRRTLPMPIFAGKPFIVHLETTNPRPKSWRSLSSWGIVVVDRIQPIHNNSVEKQEKFKPYEPAVYFEYIPNGQTRKKTYAGRLTQRGRYKIGPAMISTRFPFGFFRHWMEQPIAPSENTEFCVYPKLGKLSVHWKTRQHEANESQQRHRYRPARVSSEFLGVRRWQRGDSKKWIHWRAWAKHQEPVVRQFEQNQNRDCAVLIDLYQEEEFNEIQRENFELAISFTATLVSELTRRGGCNLFFSTNNGYNDYLYGQICLPIVESILYRLALAEPSREDGLAAALFKAVSQIDPSAELILITPTPLDLRQSPRFRASQADPHFRMLLQRIRIVNTASDDLETIFSV
ncbi:MAG: DUF58 domain-containing protein [Planctomycetaceae bacterium]|jgi:uncharacterized protein (DUF58 family)|nr:DUF58 domain-containing protein [Planctomycetaceae bacterium]